MHSPMAAHHNEAELQIPQYRRYQEYGRPQLDRNDPPSLAEENGAGCEDDHSDDDRCQPNHEDVAGLLREYKIPVQESIARRHVPDDCFGPHDRSDACHRGRDSWARAKRRPRGLVGRLRFVFSRQPATFTLPPWWRGGALLVLRPQSAEPNCRIGVGLRSPHGPENMARRAVKSRMEYVCSGGDVERSILHLQ